MKDPSDTTWADFLAELRADILPLYREHERTFDHASIHGRMHICRCLIFAEFMCRYYARHTRLAPHVPWVRYAVAFHDSGREGNGPDVWEQGSARRCGEYLESRYDADVANTIGRLITKDDRATWGLEKRIVHDADVLDIMRPSCGHGGRSGFREQALRFLGQRDEPAARNASVRRALVDEAWEFIQVSEQWEAKLRASDDYMEDVLQVLRGMSDACRLLAECFAE